MLTLIIFSVASSSSVLAVQQLGKKSTPDPYFNPKLQQPVQTITPPETAPELSEWKPPRTSTTISTTADSSLTVGLSSTPSKSIIREQKPTQTNSDRTDAISPEKTTSIGGDFSADLSNFRRPVNKIPTQSAGLTLDSNTNPTNSKTRSSPTVTPPNAPPKFDVQAVHDTRPKATRNASAAAGSALNAAKPFEPSQLLVRVGNEPIFVGDMLFEINQLIEKFMPTAPQSVKDSETKLLIKRLLPKFVDAKMLYVGTLQQLPKEADVSKILEQAGKEFDENAMLKMMDSAGLKSPNEFDAHLRAQGSSLRKMRLSWSQDQLTKYFLSKQLEVDKEITHQAMLDEYHKHIDEYEIPAKVRWEQVMVRFDRTSSRAEAEKQLVEMGNQIVYGANFASVAKKGSHGYSAFSGGQHDWTTQGALVLKELDDAIFSLPVGELSDKIETTDGFHIVRVIERTKASRKSFLEAQVEIKERLQDEKRTAAFQKHLKKLRNEIRVEYFEGTDLQPPTNVAEGKKSFSR